MSSLAADILIWVLLFAGVLFGGIAIMGLMLFPDTKSRMFTAFRASAISCGAVSLSAIVYAVTLFSETGSDVYTSLVLRTVSLAVVLGIGSWMIYGIIREKTKAVVPAGNGQADACPETGKKDGE
ncbi:hypothetical protein [Methanoregula sp. PtaB.Bin085]|uniref:hypothetical protein n=1 Tax=Methanoregula sp. PtaB.Bin085 TaxID=1811680 RepID=UPI0009D0F3BE|nr:hypothetical protein [Methanoregula sp. PtaB.Bin085]OPX63793.1 MAG: putative monovalent cation/H+ antiporter subunit G [Methanoregula sp. PtaB.Bin085]